MPFVPDHQRAARLGLPRLPLAAILAFSIVGLGGALFLAYSSFRQPETTYSPGSANKVVYTARAVPTDSSPEDIAQGAVSIARALTATAIDSQQRSATSEAPGEQAETTANPTLLSGANSGLRGFARFANASVANSYLALTGATFGMSAQMVPSGFAAPAAKAMISTPVPEASTWLCGLALIALVAVRGIHATWHRNQRRGVSKSDSLRS